MRIKTENCNLNIFLPIVIMTVYLLILVGPIVRSTGSGMGCPDWPTCFGKIIPPFSVEELLPDYKIKYAVRGRKIANFNPYKTWTEYINRLLGVWTGIASLILFFMSFKYRKDKKEIFNYAGLSLALVIFNGWLGSIVVKTHLIPRIITLHMIFAIFLVFSLLKLKEIVNPLLEIEVKYNFFIEIKRHKKILLIFFILLLLQIILGTQVREQIDHITNETPNLSRERWISKLDFIFYIHRSFSGIILFFYLMIRRKVKVIFKENDLIQKKMHKISICILIEIIAGVIISYFDFPRFIQPFHLFIAVLLISFVFELYLLINSYKSTQKIYL